VSGEGTALDAEALFQLLHLYFTAPRTDSAAFRAWLGGQLGSARDRATDPDDVFRDTLAVTLGQHHPRSLPPTPDNVRQIDLGRALSFYRVRFGNASNFTVVLVGSFTPDRVRQLVLRYLASLPAGSHEAPRDDGMRFPAGIVSRTVVRGREAKSTAHFTFSGDLPPDSRSAQLLQATRDLLARALEARLRNTLGGTYGVDVDASVGAVPHHQYAIDVEFTTAPDQLDAMTQAMFAEIGRLREQGPTAAETGALVAAEVRDARSALTSNESWRAELRSHTRFGWPLAGIVEHPAEIEHFDATTLRDAMRRYVDPARYVRVVRVPENGH
jgi:zinc protease